MKTDLSHGQPPRDSAAADVLAANGLSVTFDTPHGLVPTIHGIDIALRPGEILGLVGESGSGKSVTCQALLGLLPNNAQVDGTARIQGSPLALSDRAALARLRGRHMSMIFQDPMSALDPLMSVRRHLFQRLRRHGATGDLTDQALTLLRRAGIADTGRIFDAYPHQLSGGLCQRVAIALALAGAPEFLVADEPTTALDVTIQAQVLDLFAELRAREGLAIVLISHDLGVVAEICDRVSVMYQGSIVETGAVDQVLTAPVHDYTRSLLAARPDIDSPLPARAASAGSEPLLTVRNAGVTFRSNDGSDLRALDGVSFDVDRGETLGIVGESGSGKSTLAKGIMRLIPQFEGVITLGGQAIDTATPALRRRMQYVFQDPLGALDPRMSVLSQVREPLDIHRIGTKPERRERALSLMEAVGLHPDLHASAPIEISGGQRQRVVLARALALQPEILICDEPVSALDVSTQAQVLDLLADLRRKLGLTMLFISHDLSVVRQVSDRIAVMRRGEIVELAPVDQIFRAPRHDYTRTLLKAVPRIGHRRRAPELVPA